MGKVVLAGDNALALWRQGAAGLSMLHGFLSYLFLIGLGLRNRFRL